MADKKPTKEQANTKNQNTEQQNDQDSGNATNGVSNNGVNGGGACAGGASGGARVRTSSYHSNSSSSPPRYPGLSQSYRRSQSPQYVSNAVNGKSSRRQNRSQNENGQCRSSANIANGVAAYVSANSVQTRNHGKNQGAHPQEVENEGKENDSDEIAAEGVQGAVAIVNPMPERDRGGGEGIQAPPIGEDIALDVPPAQGAVPYNWQASKKTLKERMKFMFNNDIMADVFFVVGKGNQMQRIPAHKFILSTGSAVFDAMFNGAMASTSQEEEIPDVEPAAFLALLRFLYSDEVIIGPETVMTTLYTAKKYAVPALERACVEFLKQNLSSDNAFMLLTQARLFDEPQLAALCLETIDKNTTEALGAEGFTDIDLATLSVVLERDTLGIRECKLYNAVCRWSEAECVRKNIPVTNDNKRECLGNALELIRFPLMTVEEFAQGAAQSGILSDREVVELFLHFTVNPKPQVMFKDTPRCCLTGKEQVVSRFIQVENRWGYSGTSDRIRFQVNRRIFIVGFGLYGSIHGPADYTSNIQIIHTDTGKVCGQNDCSFQCDGSVSTFRVMFKEPVEIMPNTTYTASATLKGPDSYYGTKGLRKVTHESVSSGKVTFTFTYAAGNNNGTSVEDGQLPEIIFYT